MTRGMKSWMFFAAALILTNCSNNSETNLQSQKSDSIPKQLIDSTAISTRSQKLDSVFHSLQKNRNFNGVVLVAHKGSIVYRNAFGYANLKTKDTLTTDHIFQLASVSKQFTAAAIMLLEEKGKLKYSDLIEKYLPGFPYEGITIHQLLTHRSGLSNYMYFCDDICRGKDTLLSCHDVVCIMEELKPQPYYQPDTKFNYNNTNYMLLAAIVERVAGMKFSEFVDREIFKPLGMNSTFVYDRTQQLNNPKVATGYYSIKRPAEDNYLDGVIGDKSVYSTIDDLFLWDQALYTDKLLSQKTLQIAWTPASPEKKNGRNYGYGWRLWTMRDSTKMIYHNGWWHGFNSNFIRIPGDSITVIVLRNIANRSFHFYDVPEVLRIVQPGKYKALFPSGTETDPDEE